MDHTYRNDNLIIDIPARYLKALSFMTASKDVRYYLNGIHIKNGIAEATNGHVAMRIESRDIVVYEDGADIILSNDSVKRICASILKKNLASTITIDGKYHDLIDGSFPDVPRVMVDPDNCSGDIAQFDPELLMRFKKAIKVLWPLAKKNVGAFELVHNGNGCAPVIFKGEDEAAIKGVVMPWRV